MSDQSEVRRMKDVDQAAYCRAATVVMSREELDVLLSVDLAIAKRDDDEPTVVLLTKRKIAV